MSEQSKFHLSLYVGDIPKSVEFYGKLLGIAPKKMFADYAKFEVEDPGLVLSLEKRKDGQTTLLNHIGIKLDTKNQLIDWTSKVAERGVEFQHLDSVACCYADQSKIYMNDPDGVLFEVYNVNRDLEPSSNAQPSVSENKEGSNARSYDHILPSEFPDHLDFADNSLEAVSLRGSLNAEISNEKIFSILQESKRVLKPGAEIVLHMLASDSEPAETIPTLPEPASYVRRIPSEKFIWESLREAGFVGLKAERFSANHVFEFKGSRFRELLLKASKLSAPRSQASYCIYLGPFPSVEIESGASFRRGKRIEINGETFGYLSSPTYKDMFVFLNDDGSACGN